MAGANGFMKHNPMSARGVTLVEVMIVVVIVGIMAAVAYPAYQEHVLRASRVSAGACLVELAQFMERTYTQNMSYNPVGFDLPTLSCQIDTATRYSYSVDNHSARTYTLSATPQGPQASDDCGTLTLTQTGQKGAAGGTDATVVQKCW